MKSVEIKSETNENILEIPKETLKEIEDEVLNQPIEVRRFIIDGIRFALRPCSSKNKDGSVNGVPAEYANPENEFAIYIWKDLPVNIQRVLLFHEIVEIYFRAKLDEKLHSAHNATLPYEDKVRKELLSTDEEREIQELRDKYKGL